LSTCYIACKFCGGEIGSAQEMKVLKESPDGITEACHPECEPVTMKCLSVQQPWANAIFFLGKDVENRSWPTDYRGSLLIHTGKRVDGEALRKYGNAGGPLVTGAIIGLVNLVGIRQDSASQWAQPDCWHWLLADQQPLAEPIPYKGQLGIFQVQISKGAALLKGASHVCKE
jgi:hypothetical protein